MNKIRLAVLLLLVLVVATIAAGGLGHRAAATGPYASALSSVGIGNADARPFPTCNTYCANASGRVTCRAHDGINQNCVLQGGDECINVGC
jgi:hypothetical protein